MLIIDKDGTTKVKKESGTKTKAEAKAKAMSKKRLNEDVSSPKKETIKKVNY